MTRVTISTVACLVALQAAVASGQPMSAEEEFLKRFEQMGVDPEAESDIRKGKRRLTATIDFPAVGLLLKWDGQAFRPSCTVTLIAPDRVLTAAHCVCDYSTAANCGKLEAANYKVYFQHAGTFAVQDKSASGNAKDVGVVVHPAWSGELFNQEAITFVSDLAVLRLEPKVTTIHSVRVAAQSDTPLEQFPKAVAAGFGWNRRTIDKFKGIKFHGIALDVLRCEAMYPRDRSSSVGKGVESLCVLVDNVGPNGFQGPICSGDSGGPLFEYRGNDDQQFVMIGVVNSVWKRTADGISAVDGCAENASSVSVFTDLRAPSNNQFVQNYAATTSPVRFWNAILNDDEKFVSSFDRAFRRTGPSGTSESEKLAWPAGGGRFAVSIAMANLKDQPPPEFSLTLTRPDGTSLIARAEHGVLYKEVDETVGNWKLEVVGPPNRRFQFGLFRTK